MGDFEMSILDGVLCLYGYSTFLVLCMSKERFI